MKKLLRLLLVAAAAFVFLYQQTNTLKTTRYTWQSGRVPAAFEGFRIVQISDLHNKRFGKSQVRLLRAVRAAKPDMIALTGDIISRNTTNFEPTRELIEGLCGLAPLYYVDGNHDPVAPCYDEFLALLHRCGVAILDGPARLERGGDAMTLAGYGYWDISIPTLAPADLVLYHNPDWFAQLAQAGCGLLLAGHIHGGQIALPGGRAVLSPGLGFFPKYSAGVYREGEATMVLSRGLGTSVVPLRILAPPEIVVVTLESP